MSYRMHLPILFALAIFSACALPAKDDLEAPQRLAELPKEIPESSGLIRSRKNPNVFWTHNDSGNAPEIFAIDAKAKITATCKVQDAQNVDWEDIAMDEQGRIVIADFGDNFAKRKECCLYRISEPNPAQSGPTEKAQAFRFVYPEKDGPVDAEALIVRAGSAYVFTKEKTRVRVFRVPLPEEPPKEAQTAELVAETDKVAYLTGADCSPDGKYLALLSYGVVQVIALPDVFETIKPLKPFEGTIKRRGIFLGQAEGIAWKDDDLYITTEGGAMWMIPKAK